MKRIGRREFVQTGGRWACAAAGAAMVFHTQSARAAAKGDKIKVGQIGTAHAHAAGKMEVLRRFAEMYEVVGIVEPEPKRQAILSRPPYQGLPVMTEEQMLNVPGLRAVAIETEVRDLVPTALRAVRTGMHVHVDKPAGESLAAFKELLDEATRRRRTVQMGYMFRYNPAFKLCFQAVRERWLGDVFELHAVMSKKVDAATRRELAQYPGGSMFELGCHVIDALVAVLGKPDKVMPFGRATRPDDPLADNQLAVFEYPRATATVRSSVVEPHGGARRQFTVCGDEGTFDIRPLEPPQAVLSLEKARGSYKAGIQELSFAKMPGRYDGDFLDLAAIIREEKPSDYPPAHDLAVHEAVLRASGVAVR